jgi:hypothetical protein
MHTQAIAARTNDPTAAHRLTIFARMEMMDEMLVQIQVCMSHDLKGRFGERVSTRHCVEHVAKLTQSLHCMTSSQ